MGGSQEAESVAGSWCPESAGRALRMGQGARPRRMPPQAETIPIPQGAPQHELHQKLVPPGRRPALVSQWNEPSAGRWG